MADIDPALAELLDQGGPEDEVAVIIRLDAPSAAPPDVRIVARFGHIATCRLRRGSVLPAHAEPAVASMKAPALMRPEVELEEAAPNLPLEAVPEADDRRPRSRTETGRGVVVAFIDWGLDFAHPDFRREDGSTRLLALWDQRPGPDPQHPNRYGYGVIHTEDDINRALAAPDPYAHLSYHPADSDTGPGAHGTHTCGIAAGNGRAGGPLGVAPEADLVFVHLSTWGEDGLERLGDSVALLEGVDFIRRTAGDRPWVLNLSMGRLGDSHTGLSLVEQGLDAVVTEAPGRACIHSTGNYYSRGIHTYGLLRPGEERSLQVEIDAGKIIPHQIDLWYAGRDRLTITVTAPDGSPAGQAGRGEQAALRAGGKEVGSLYNRRHDPNTGENEALIFLYPSAPAGQWELRLSADDVVDGRYHAWIERDAACTGCQPHFAPDDVVRTTTTGSICNGFHTVAVGAYDAHSPDRELGAFSSSGPTADGRQKPDLVAPGVSVLAARSAPRPAQADAPLLTRMSGTSMAAPHVTGTVALMFEAAGRPLAIEETRNALLAGSEHVEVEQESRLRIGSGYLDIDAAVEAVGATLTPQPPLPPVGEGEQSAEESGEERTMVLTETIGEDVPEYRDEMMSVPESDPTASESSTLDTVIPLIIVASAMQPRAPGATATAAEEAIAAGHLSADAFLSEVLGRAGAGSPSNGGGARFPTASEVFQAFASPLPNGMREQVEQIFEIVSAPGGRVPDSLQRGDLIVRSMLGEGPAHVAVVASPELRAPADLATAGIRGESGLPGLYVHIIEGGYRPHTESDAFARMVSDSLGNARHDQVVVRLRSEAIAPELDGEWSSNGAAETVAIPAGREELSAVPLLAEHNGVPPQLILRWNDMQTLPSVVDVVVHFHGFSDRRDRMSLVNDKEPVSGLDFADPNNPRVLGPGRTRPTLAILPRGKYTGGDPGATNPASYGFPALTTSSGLGNLIAFALQHWGTGNGVPNVRRGRLILTGHSGGGRPLVTALQFIDPDEIELFDALYRGAPMPNLITWVQRHLQRDIAALSRPNVVAHTYMETQGSSIRVLYLPGAGTQDNSGAVQAAICALLPPSSPVSAVVRPWYRVERPASGVQHGAIPRVYGWQLLANAGADLPGVTTDQCTHHHSAASAPAGREHPPLLMPLKADEAIAVEDVPAAEDYSPPGFRAYTPATATFRCAPDVPAVTATTSLPIPAADPDDAARTALRACGVTDPHIHTFEHDHGFEGLRSIAALFGSDALTELLRRTRYNAARLVDPPHFYDNAAQMRRATGAASTKMGLAPRLLVAIPGHFRELARRAPSAEEAFALECLGWLIMQSLRDDIAGSTGISWWIPPAPVWVAPFPNPLPPLSQALQTLLLRTGLIDTLLDFASFTGRFRTWRDGLPGHAWRLETGIERVPEGPGLPFYARLVQIPATVNIDPQRQQVQQVFNQRVAAAEAQFPNDLNAQAATLTRCDEHFLAGLNLFSAVSLHDMEMATAYPAKHTARGATSLRVLSAIQPTLDVLFATASALGWNDLLFQTGGAGCFRGVKQPGNPAAAKHMSDHALGIAIDFNAHENTQDTHNPSGSMDPRIVALFEAFHFRWGRCFRRQDGTPVPDPMHFEYCGAAC